MSSVTAPDSRRSSAEAALVAQRGGREVESIRIKVLIAKCDMAILIEKEKKGEKVLRGVD